MCRKQLEVNHTVLDFMGRFKVWLLSENVLTRPIRRGPDKGGQHLDGRLVVRALP